MAVDRLLLIYTDVSCLLHLHYHEVAEQGIFVLQDAVINEMHFPQVRRCKQVNQGLNKVRPVLLTWVFKVSVRHLHNRMWHRLHSEGSDRYDE